MRLTCLRHGETPANVAGIFNGSCQEGITAEQRDSLREVSFDSSQYEVTYCSSLNRCVETARALSIPAYRLDARIAERDLGVFEGLTADQCRHQYSAPFAAFERLDADYCIPDGESRSDHLRRVMEWLEEVVSHTSVLTITHGGTIDFLYRMGTGGSLHGGESIFGSLNASLTTFDVDWPSINLLDYSVAL